MYCSRRLEIYPLQECCTLGNLIQQRRQIKYSGGEVNFVSTCTTGNFLIRNTAEFDRAEGHNSGESGKGRPQRTGLGYGLGNNGAVAPRVGFAPKVVNPDGKHATNKPRRKEVGEQGAVKNRNGGHEKRHRANCCNRIFTAHLFPGLEAKLIELLGFARAGKLGKPSLQNGK